MPDLLASASLLSLTPAVLLRTAPAAAPVAADFTVVLGDLLLPPGSSGPGAKGQALAGDGKNLPVADQPGDDGKEEADPLVAWLPAGALPLPAVDRPLPDMASGFSPQLPEMPAAADAGTAPAAGSALHGTAASAGCDPRGWMIAAPATAGTVASPDAGAAGAPPAAARSVPTGPVLHEATGHAPVEAAAAAVDADAAARQGTPDAPAPSPRGNVETAARVPRARPAHAAIPQPVVPGGSTAPTAAQVFAAAMSTSFDSPAAPAPRAADPAIGSIPVAAEQLRTTVQAMSGTEQAPLDLSRDDWAGKMVDRIAAMRDAAEAADTRIRLAPENLGNVDVSIRRDGDRIHVHFAAENGATRQLLAEAAPRLAELADARGIKLGQASVDAGTGGRQQQSAQPQAGQPARPVSAAAGTTQSNRDDRVA